MVTVTQGEDAGKQRRRRRYGQLHKAWRVSSLPRVRACRRRRISVDRPVEVAVNAAGAAHYRGLQACGSVHSCPCCAAKIRAQRAVEVEAIVGAQLERGGRAAFVTLTVPHDQGDELEGLWDAVAGCWSSVLAGRAWADMAAAAGASIGGRRRIGSIRSLEVTYGRNGWHPHLHVILLYEGDGEAIRDLVVARWAHLVQKAGLRKPHDIVGVTWTPVLRKQAGEFAAYLVKEQDGRKIGSEVARHDLKVGRRAGRTPFQLLDDGYDDGDLTDLARYHTFERASKGRQAVTFSKGLRAEFQVAERTDQEIVDGPEDGEVVATLAEYEWETVRQSAVALEQLLEVAERGEDVHRFVELLGQGDGRPLAA